MAAVIMVVGAMFTLVFVGMGIAFTLMGVRMSVFVLVGVAVGLIPMGVIMFMLVVMLVIVRMFVVALHG